MIRAGVDPSPYSKFKVDTSFDISIKSKSGCPGKGFSTTLFTQLPNQRKVIWKASLSDISRQIDLYGINQYLVKSFFFGKSDINLFRCVKASWKILKITEPILSLAPEMQVGFEEKGKN